MPVEDNTDLRKPLTDSMVDKMHKQADQMERDAERLARAQTTFTNILGTHAQGKGYQKGYNPKDPSVYDPSTAAATPSGHIAHVMKGGMKPGMGSRVSKYNKCKKSWTGCWSKWFAKDVTTKH